jgi:predicted cation transporter
VASTVLTTVEPYLLGALSQSTGSVVVDGIIGGTTGYLMAPNDARARYAVGGAVATGLGGALGLLGTIAFILATQHDSSSRKPRRKRRR